MAIHVALNHKTQYRYDRSIHLGPQVVRLRPAPHCRTPILAYSLKIEPANHFINWQQDPQGNYLARLVFPETTERFSVEVDLVAEMSVFNPFDFFVEPAAENFPFTYDVALTRELRPFLETEPADLRLASWLSKVSRTPLRTIDFLIGINQRVQSEIGYVIRMEPGVQSCEQTLTLGTGSCRDSAWLLVQIMRHLGLAARFVSGYLIQLTPDVKPLEGPAGPTSDFTDLHAWTEVYLPGAGWVGLDPTSGLLAGEGHIPLACTPDAGSAAPVSGLLDPCNTQFSHEMAVTRIFESPRVTRPYSEAQWQQISALGQAVDSDLKAGDVRLTMGGEPTFVSIDDADGAEWTTRAFGPDKRRLSFDLFLKLRDRFSSGALLHFGQGKWYPGEPLPRWSLACYWRRDGVAIWEDPALIIDDNREYRYNASDARRFLEALTKRLEIDNSFIMTALEDVFYYMWKERRLPANVDPLDSKLADPLERAQMARVFEEGLGRTVGYVLPLRKVPVPSGSFRWTSQPWFLATQRLFLAPGDSAMGYRLPLESLPWTKAEDVEWSFETDPFQERDKLPERPRSKKHLFAEKKFANPAQRPHGKPAGKAAEKASAKAAEKGESSPWISRPALCVQVREGKLFIFMPPVEYLADYLDLIFAIEDAAAHTGIPVAIEGYAPPYDPRIAVLKVTPDPGVIEVNIQPASSWDELVGNTTTLYDLARQARLGAEKFMLDGRHSGTGGGNHVVIGGATPADSAFLRRPDLLRSMVGFWQNHPSLSYLFSGLFIGPTSQHPRVDEARMDNLYELEIAFSQVPDKDEGRITPWLVDRIFRNLLIDLTGNTHRTEICIDKLYPPDSASSRLGLVELRSFEMPPHARMSLAQQLLVRALIAHFWKTPLFNNSPRKGAGRRKLVPWGTALHDRFMLPYFVERDFEDVLEELNNAGYAFQKDWFAPHFEFRFPAIGSITKRGIALELRNALEPWNVLGEEASGGGTARNVDSSVERLQVRVSGLIDHRFVVLCNKRRVPLYPTGTPGEYVAGVRYRAWQPPACLHPNIPVHSPLVFDILDSWSGRSIGGCTYHVSHPGGRANEQFPVNAYEAESRRLARFTSSGHTPGLMAMPRDERNPDFPLTLDLRRPLADHRL
ncbi:MAG: transglutaminase family protein [Acidobacteriota bacterium]|nr:transglutaminase family protein [Acidobacteriota bacterium]